MTDSMVITAVGPPAGFHVKLHYKFTETGERSLSTPAVIQQRNCFTLLHRKQRESRWTSSLLLVHILFIGLLPQLTVSSWQKQEAEASRELVAHPSPSSIHPPGHTVATVTCDGVRVNPRRPCLGSWRIVFCSEGLWWTLLQALRGCFHCLEMKE